MSILPQRGFSSTKAVYSVNLNEKRQYIIDFLKEDNLQQDQISYFSHCIVEYLMPEDESSQKDIQEEPTLTEDEIKLFITINNSSLLSPIEYQYFYDKFSKDEQQEEVQEVEEPKKLQYA